MFDSSIKDSTWESFTVTTKDPLFVTLMEEFRRQRGRQGRTDVIPALMPYITSQFLVRKTGDRPPVVPPRSTNLAFIGQYADVPDDVVFSVECSVRTAWTAVATLLKLDRQPPPVDKGQHDPKVLVEAIETMHRRYRHLSAANEGRVPAVRSIGPLSIGPYGECCSLGWRASMTAFVRPARSTPQSQRAWRRGSRPARSPGATS